MAKPLAVLIVEDMESDAQLLVRMLTKAGYSLTFERVETAAQMRSALEKQAWDMVISDFSMPGLDGFGSLKILQETGLDIPFIVVSGTMGEETAVAMMKAGAHDYVMKGNLARLAPAVERELGQAELRREARRVEHQKQERVKELRTLFGLSMIIERESITLDEVYQELANILPAGWQYPEITCARIVVNGSEFCTPNFKESAWMQSAPITLDKLIIGKIEVGYLEKRSVEAEGPFMQEERKLIDALAERLGRFIELTRGEILLKMTYKISQAAEQAESLEALFPAIHANIRAVMKADNFYFALYDEENDLLSFPYSVDEEDHLLYPPQKPGKGLTEYVIRTGRSFLCSDMALFKKMRKQGELELVGSNSLIWLGVPLTIAGKVIGVMAVQDYQNDKAYTEREQGILEFVSIQVATVIQRKQAELELQHSKTYLEDILRTTPSAVFTIDPDKKITSWNLMAERITGYTATEVIGKECDILASSTCAGNCRLFDDRIEKPGDYRECEIVSKDGRNVTTLKNFDLLKDTSGRVIGGIESFIDITERRQAEEALRASEQRQRTILETAMDGFWLVDMQGSLLEVNETYCRMSGYSKQELLAMHIPELESIESTHETGDHIQKIIEQGEDRFVSLHRRKDGSCFEVEVSVQYQAEEGGRFVAFIQDISERKQALVALQDSEARYRTLFLGSTDGILIADLESRMFRYANPAICRLLGYSEAELRTMGVSDIHPKADLPAVMAEFEAQASGDKTLAEGLPCLRKDGTIIYADVTAIAMSIDGKASNVGFFRDVTERKQAAEELRESNELFSLFMKNSPMYVFIKEVTPSESRNQKISDNFQDMLGIPASDIVGKTMAELFPADLAAKMTADDWAVVSNAVVLRVDEEFNGRSYTSIKFPIIQGDKTLLAGYTIDITERKQAEAKIQSLAKFPSENPGPILRIALDGTLLYVNPAGLRLLAEWHLQAGQAASPMLHAAVLKAINAETTQLLDLEYGEQVYSFFVAPIVAAGYANLYGHDVTEKKASVEKLQKTVEGAINTIALIVEARDPYTSGHQKRVANISVAVAKELGLPEEQIQGIYFASLVHDLGKIQVPSEILSKPGKLTKLEFELIKTHSKVGYELLKEIEFPWPIAEIVYQHHERENGSGYPRKLKGNRISIEAKIIGIADVIEAMSSHRPYRPARGLEAALDEINKNKGILYDPEIAETFIKAIKKDKTLIPSP